MVGWRSRTAERVARSTPPAASPAMSNVPRWTAVSGSKKPSPRFRTRSTYDSRWTRRRSAIVAVGGISTPWKSPSRSRRSTMDRRRSGLSTWRGDGTWSRNRESYTITYDGKRGVDFKASSGPKRPAEPRRFDGRHGRAKVFTHRLQVGTSLWKSDGPCRVTVSGFGLLLRRIFGDA